jgi:hypothetical protein
LLPCSRVGSRQVCLSCPSEIQHSTDLHLAMGNQAAELAGMAPDDVPVKLEDSVKGLITVFDKADKATYSGKFWDQTDNQLPW